MMVREELVHAGASAPGVEAIDQTLANQSTDELRTIASRGVHGGDLYFAAAAELERRARESEAEEVARRAEAAARRQHLILLTAGLISVVTAILLLWQGL